MVQSGRGRSRGRAAASEMCALRMAESRAKKAGIFGIFLARANAFDRRMLHNAAS